MFLKSVFQNKIFINFTFFILLIFTGVLFLNCFFVHKNQFNIPLLNGIDADIRVNIEGEGRVFANDKELKYSKIGSYKTFELDNFPVYKLVLSDLRAKSAVVSIGDRLFCFENPDKELVFPYKYNKNSTYITDKGFFKHLQAAILAPFYNFWFYLIPFSFLFSTLLIYKFQKNKINLKISSRAFLFLILALALFVRLSDLSLLFWTDELYSAYVAGNFDLPFSMTFFDAGNPPLFFILLWLFEAVASKNEAMLRLLPLSLSFLTVFFLYYFVKKEADEKMALLASFLFAINIYAIVSAQELRVYSLVILLSVLISIYFFKIKNNASNKNYLIYFLLGALAFNTHYFMSFILFANFILSLFWFKSGKLKFFLINCLSALTFLPFLLMTGLKKGLLDENFNVFMRPDFHFYVDTFVKFAQGKITSLAIIVFLIVLLFKRREKTIFLYSIYMIFLVFLFSYIFSFIKPMCQTYYFICLLPFFIILPAFICCYFKGWVKFAIILLLFVSYFGQKDYINRDKERLLNFYNIASFYLFDKNDNSALIVPHSKEMVSLAFGINLDEIYVLLAPQTVDKLARKIDSIDKTHIYVKLEHKNLMNFLNETYEKYETSFVRVNKDAIIARVSKRVR